MKLIKNQILNQTIQENSKVIEDIVYDIVKQYTSPLDSKMQICRDIFNSPNKITNQEIEDLLAQLPSCLYFVTEGQEIIGIRESIAEMAKKETFIIAREKAIGTIQDKNTTAEGASIEEAINQIIYNRAYKMIKSKIDMAQEMINSLKRIFDARMADYQISQGGRR